MEYEITNGPSNAVLTATLDEGETIEAKTGTMVSRSASTNADARVGGGDGLKGMLSRAISDERETVSNAFTAEVDGAHVTLAPDVPGDVVAIDLAETGRIKAQSGSPLAWTPEVEHETALNDARNFFSSNELTVLAMSGDGIAFLSSYGSIYSVDIADDDPLIVDEDHLVAWTDGLDLSRERDGGIKSSVLGGEGRVTRFSGAGTVWLQTRNPLVFANALSADNR
ncbi:TIGR00266 family protein [Haladaptatus salinisoli]|uniref:TIGR00266 family protein n=1 Tax=Haladaptatus salinisoli TaxID=2884876 RepID=UPI001D0AA0FE|nr:TIGR00266 family protein [Haladaptatus salinisoli]